METAFSVGRLGFIAETVDWDDELQATHCRNDIQFALNALGVTDRAGLHQTHAAIVAGVLDDVASAIVYHAWALGVGNVQPAGGHEVALHATTQ